MNDVCKPFEKKYCLDNHCPQALYNSGDAEAYGLALALSSYSGVATINLLSVVVDLLAKLNCFMQ